MCIKLNKNPTQFPNLTSQLLPKVEKSKLIKKQISKTPAKQKEFDFTAIPR